MYNQPHAIYLKLMTLKQINNCPENYLCILISFMLERLSLQFSINEENKNTTLI